KVVSCGAPDGQGGKDATVTPSGSQQLSIVAYFADRATVADCIPDTSPCHDTILRMYAAPTTGVKPPNDAMAQATPISSVPFTQTVDSTLATPDGPFLVDYKQCSPSTVRPRLLSTVWWRYKRVSTGPVPVSVEPVEVPPGVPFFPLNI